MHPCARTEAWSPATVSRGARSGPPVCAFLSPLDVCCTRRPAPSPSQSTRLAVHSARTLLDAHVHHHQCVAELCSTAETAQAPMPGAAEGSRRTARVRSFYKGNYPLNHLHARQVPLQITLYISHYSAGTQIQPNPRATRCTATANERVDRHPELDNRLQHAFEAPGGEERNIPTALDVGH